jgi:hypothetical protein
VDEAAAFLEAPADWIAPLLPLPPGSPGTGWFDAPTERRTKLDSKPEVTRLGRRVAFRRLDFAGWLDLPAGTARVVAVPPLQAMALESFLRIAYSFLALHHGGLLLHSAAIARGGKGYVFPGQSETGKSTIASFTEPPDLVLSDEMVVLRPGPGTVTVHSSPFFGTNETTTRNVGVPVRAILLPIKAPQVALQTAAPGRAVTKLMAATMCFDSEPATSERLLDIATRIAAAGPVLEMRFRRDGSFWRAIDEWDRKESAAC